MLLLAVPMAKERGEGRGGCGIQVSADGWGRLGHVVTSQRGASVCVGEKRQRRRARGVAGLAGAR